MIRREKRELLRGESKGPPRSFPIGRILLLLLVVFLLHNYAKRSSGDEENSALLTFATEEIDSDSFSEEEKDFTEGENAEEEEGEGELFFGVERAEMLSFLTDTLKLWQDPRYMATQSDTVLARIIGQLLERHHPDGAFWMLSDGSNNQILAWGQYNDSALQRDPDYASRTTFPAASLAKIVTAAAALESKEFTPESTQPLVGRSTTLYKQQLNVASGAGTPVSLLNAFARSMNPPMALLGKEVGAIKLKQAATRLGFNLEMPQQIPGRANYAPPDTGYGLAEVACGFTKKTTLSPLQAAGMAYAVYSGEAWMPAWSPQGPHHRFPDRPIAPAPAFDRHTLSNLRTLFEATATSGTSRRALRKTIYPHYSSRVEVGGKTGSLDGRDPWGRYDWFVGYAYEKNDPKNAVIITVMQYHRRLRSLPSSQVAGVLINHWAKLYLDQKNPPLGG